MDLDMAAHVLTGVIAVRVFAGDIRPPGKRLPSAGVRVGAVQLVAQCRRGEPASRRSGVGDERLKESR
ncbi:hypothetical protein [Streptomyces sp. enrichment culture]|uniref:hypothetical protein n=1 Tax=Streptomyces sp. enrichment culture TaxID=1795815 RepID=UPI003F550018